MPPINSNVQDNQNTLPNLVDNVTSQFIVTPADQIIIGVSGFIFSIIGDEEMSLDAEITDSYTETNISYQDQIALRPEQFTLSGYVGELVNSFPNLFTDIITTLQIFGSPPGMGATLNTQDQQYYERLALIAASEASIINTAESIYGLFSGLSTTASAQQNAFQYFYNLWLSRTLCQVQTPWGTLENMAILNVRARQDETTRLFTSFSVTFKAMRFASTTSQPTSPATTSQTQASPAVPPQPSTAASDQANATLQNVPENCSESGTATDNSNVSEAITGLNLGS